MSDCITTLIAIIIVTLLLGDNRDSDCRKNNRSSNEGCNICGSCGR